jgi:hypothetical protein
MPNKFGICHSAITVYCRRDCKRGSISRTNSRHPIIVLCGRGDFACEAHSELGAQMAITFLDLIVVLLWPLVLSSAAWAIAIYALSEKDEISKVVEALTRPNGVDEKRKAWRLDSPSEHKVYLRRGNLSAIASGNGGWFQVHFRPMRHRSPG